jgi:hypothetical protein
MVVFAGRLQLHEDLTTRSGGEGVFEGVGHQFVDDQAGRDGLVQTQGNIGDLQLQPDVPRIGTIRTRQMGTNALQVLRKADLGEIVRKGFPVR